MAIRLFTLVKKRLTRVPCQQGGLDVGKVTDKELSRLYELGARMTLAESRVVRMRLWRELRQALADTCVKRGAA